MPEETEKTEDSPSGPGGVEWRVLALQLFVVPGALVAACAGIFWSFGRMGEDGQDARDLLAEIRRSDGGLVFDKNARWYAARRLGSQVIAERDLLAKDPRFCQDLIEAFENRSYPDPQMRAWLAIGLGKLGNPQAIPALERGLGENGKDGTDLVRYASAWALGALGDPAAAPAIVPLLADPSPSVRKVAAYSLGALGAREPLRSALADGVLEVRWTAAVWLARLGDAEAAPALKGLLDRKAFQGLDEPQAAFLLEHAARAAGRLRDPSLREALIRLGADPAASVRMAASEALSAYDRPAQPLPLPPVPGPLP